MKKICNYLSLILFCTSCATPTVVNVIGPNDNKLNCKELSAEISKANQYADEAQKAKKMSNPHNIGALFFFTRCGYNNEECRGSCKSCKRKNFAFKQSKRKKELLS